jgi:HSP20 family molecular chaperone IbpA
MVIKMSEKKIIPKRRIWINPCPSCSCGCTDDDDDDDDVDELTLVYEIPGVKKEDIHIHIIKDRIRLIAPRFDDYEFYNEYSLNCPALIDDVTTDYIAGVLTIRIPYECPDPFKGSKVLKV